MADLSTSEARLYERRSYDRPPIAEAICEYRLAGGSELWNPALPGLLYERVRELYPATPTQAVVGGVELDPNPLGGSVTFRPPVASVELKDEDGLNAVGLGPSVLVVRTRTPYPGWEAFYERIRVVAAVYHELAPEATVQRVGLRYVNKIVIPPEQLNEAGGITLTDYFQAPPVTPDDFPANLVGVLGRWESAYDEPDRDIRLLYTFASVREEVGAGATFVLDFDVIELWPSETPASFETTPDLTDLKRLETAAFEAAITDRTRELFADGR